ncbi:hypothetical protein E4U32_003040 [Claviceps aff. humidiphila group G2b]|nr:hypothetical protein E4U32_003040 [Claviceps aff. humidiphila group G2b]
MKRDYEAVEKKMQFMGQDNKLLVVATPSLYPIEVDNAIPDERPRKQNNCSGWQAEAKFEAGPFGDLERTRNLAQAGSTRIKPASRTTGSGAKVVLVPDAAKGPGWDGDGAKMKEQGAPSEISKRAKSS